MSANKFKVGDVVEIVVDHSEAESLHGLSKGVQDVVAGVVPQSDGSLMYYLESDWYTFENEISLVGPIQHENITTGHYIWKRFEDSEKEIVLVVEDNAGLHIRTFDGVFSESLYGDFIRKLEV